MTRHTSMDPEMDEAESDEELAALRAVPQLNPPQLADDALYGIVGEYVRLVAPTTEAHPAALLVSMLSGLGVLIGRGPTMITDKAPQHSRLYVILCGPTSNGRKSTAISHAKWLLRAIDADSPRTLSGLSSGEGLIEAVRDPRLPELDDATGKVLVPGDKGEPDKRLLVVENEFGGVIHKLGRDGNTLSSVVREAFDGNTLQTMTRKRNGLIATAPHIGIIGCITPAEIRRGLSEVDIGNGFANRFLLVWTEREHLLPHGGDVPHRAETLVRELAHAVSTARQFQTVGWSASGAARWTAIYSALTQPIAAGQMASLLARGPTHVIRLAMTFALLDSANLVDAAHLDAALAVWQYCADSARYVFHASETLSARAVQYLNALHSAGVIGLDREALRKVEGSNSTPAATITAALAELREAGLVRMAMHKTTGRPREVWTHSHYMRLSEREAKEVREASPIGLTSHTSLPSLSLAPKDVVKVNVTLTTGETMTLDANDRDITALASMIAKVEPAIAA